MAVGDREEGSLADTIEDVQSQSPIAAVEEGRRQQCSGSGLNSFRRTSAGS